MTLRDVLLISIVIVALLLLTACQGQHGDQGYTGPAGPTGQNGQDATPVTVVPLCPGVSDYGTFVEVAFCIDNKLYATYSTHGGFSTYLAPGAYSSNAVNSSCNFIVLSGCEVSQ